MGSEVNDLTIGDLVQKVVDNRGKNPPYASEGFEVIETGCVTGSRRFPDYSLVKKYVDEHTYSTWFRSGHPEAGDVLLVTVGNGIGSVSIIEKARGVITQNLIGLRVKPTTNPNFLYYYLSQKHVFDYLQTLNIGSAQPSLRVPHLLSVLITVPPLRTQCTIAHILGSLDDKIELNREMNVTLESMARALFKSWFVDFDPVIDKALAAGNPIPEPLSARAETRRALAGQTTPLPDHIQKLFPDAFDEDDEKSWIPTGWNVGPILNRAVLLSGGTPKTSVDEYWNGTIKWASAKDVSQCGNAFLTETERKITREGLDNSSTKMIPRFSTVIVSRGATTGRLTMFGDDIAMNQTCYALRSKGTDHFFLYCHARDFIDSLVNSAHGSVFDTITTTTFQSTNVLLPPEKLAQQFNNLVEETFESILRNLHENQTLTKLRDTLLPQLLSGSLRIPDAEQLVASVS